MNTHVHRKKDPERLQEQLLEAASIIAAKDGIAALSLNAVAKQAGVSKGGLLHHFPGRQELIHALFIRLLAVMDRGIMALMAVDDNPRGRWPCRMKWCCVNAGGTGCCNIWPTPMNWIAAT